MSFIADKWGFVYTAPKQTCQLKGKKSVKLILRENVLILDSCNGAMWTQTELYSTCEVNEAVRDYMMFFR